MQHYCTLFDRNYAGRGLALYRSLERHGGPFRLTVLCLDEATLEGFRALALTSAELVSLKDLESEDTDLARVRTDRTPAEYYFTCKPALMLSVLRRAHDARRITYLDSDLYYFSDPSVLEEEFADGSIALTPHRFPPRLDYLLPKGRFNAGWVSASSDAEGRAFLEWWRARCIEWCKVEVDGRRFGDQGYLDEVPQLFPRTCVIDHPGANLAPWNLESHRLTSSGSSVLVDARPLVFFHFHAVRRMLGKVYDCGLLQYEAVLSQEARDVVYRPYLSALSRCEQEVASAGILSLPAQHRTRRSELRHLASRCKRAFGVVRTGTWVVAP